MRASETYTQDLRNKIYKPPPNIITAFCPIFIQNWHKKILKKIVRFIKESLINLLSKSDQIKNYKFKSHRLFSLF